jgi:hypothetical protein
MSIATDSLPPGDLDLLRILCCVAWSDGDFSPQEKALLGDLLHRYFPSEAGHPAATEAVEDLVASAAPLEMLDELAPRLGSAEDRQLALKLAYQMIRVGQRPGDDSSINPREKVAYRRLVDGLGLSETEIEQVEWAAEQDLPRSMGLLGILASRFSWLAG